ncbi:MAG: beta-N-acetylhexosaminidase, partial [Planctomycetes bacterium]|nr:beta-N-acetylhexosaminidase [Planctomycetota bacterium]
VFPSSSERTIMPLSLIPLPVSVEERPGNFLLEKTTRLVAHGDGAAEAARLLAKYLRPATGYSLPVVVGAAPAAGDIVLNENGHDKADALGFVDESHSLTVTSSRVELSAANVTGLKRAIQTLRQLFPPAIFAEKKQSGVEWRLPAVKVSDRPAFRWRGLHFDVARHFFPVADVERFIELAARHKFNVFHWHLTDDQGWRVEIRKYPRLTAVGSVRPCTCVGHLSESPRRYDDAPYGGFYTQSDVKRVVAFAAERGVTVVPEIDMPGHCQAAIAAYPELGNVPGANPGVRPHWGISQNILSPEPDTLKFMENVLGEVIRLFPSRCIHIGGDEALKYEWDNSVAAQRRLAAIGGRNMDDLQAWFIGKIAAFLRAKGRVAIGWDEIVSGGLPAGAAVMNWHEASPNSPMGRALAAGHLVINATAAHAYFDYYQADPGHEPLAIGGYLPCEKVYAFRPAPEWLKPAQKSLILGGQGQVWTEYVPDLARAEYMAYPRACALAERLWSPEGASTFRGFVDRLATHRERLNAAGVHAHPLP